MLGNLLRRIFGNEPTRPGGYGVQVFEGTSEVREFYLQASQALDRNRVARARTLYRRAQAAEPHNALALVGLGTCALQEGSLDEAIQQYEAALQLDPECASAQIGLGSVHFQAERYSLAASHYVHAAQLRGDVVDAHWGAATAYEMLGDRDRMSAHCRRVMELVPNSSFAGAAAEMMKKKT